MPTEPSQTAGRVAVLIPAAGSGQRMGGAIPKPYIPINGREIIAHTLEVVEQCAFIDTIWLVVAAEYHTWCQQAIVERYGFQKVHGVVIGGATRQESVWRGLCQLPSNIDLVVVHDGVRPFVTEALLRETLESADQHGAAIAAVPLQDTLKRVSAAGKVECTVPRDHLWRIQTPQAFRRPLLEAAYQQAWTRGLSVTDEAGLIEAFGYPVHVVIGSEYNVKITTPDDLAFCENSLRHRM